VSDEYILEDVRFLIIKILKVKMCCERYLIDFLNLENFFAINEQAELYNAERLKEYCNWFFRRHASFIP